MYQIVTDSSWDMGEERARSLGVAVVPFYVTYDGESFHREDSDQTVREMYQFMVDNPKQFPKTSQPSAQEYLETFRKYAAEGKDIVCFTLSAKFTGSFNIASIEAETVMEEYPGIRIRVMDSTLATVMQGLMIQEMVRFQRSGADFDAFCERAMQIKDTARIFFTVGNLDYLVHGGRVGKAAGISANILNLRPMILMMQGELFPMGIARGRKQSLKKAMEKIIEYVSESPYDPDHFAYIVGYGYDRDEGEKLRADFLVKLKEIWPDYIEKLEVNIGQIGATIGVHTGPWPIGFGLIERSF